MMANTLALRVKQMPHAEGLPLPVYTTPGAAGMDIVAALAEDAPLLLAPGQRGLVPSGLIMALPPEYEGQIRPRSGLALRHGVTVLNAPGTIDADYRGEVMILLVNLGQDPVVIRRGERIAQLVIAPVNHANVARVADLDSTARGVGGFGSTGLEAVHTETEGLKR
jgi:dUTP pyrophosphatase